MFIFDSLTEANFSTIASLFTGEADWVQAPDENWLNHILTTPTAHAVIVSQDTTPIGYIEFEEVSPATYTLAIFISASHRGQGIGPQVLHAFIETRPTSDQFVAHIEENNFLGRAAFKKAGFQLNGPTTQLGIHEYKLNRS